MLKKEENPKNIKISSMFKMLNSCSLQELQKFKTALLKLLTTCFAVVSSLSWMGRLIKVWGNLLFQFHLSIKTGLWDTEASVCHLMDCWWGFTTKSSRCVSYRAGSRQVQVKPFVSMSLCTCLVLWAIKKNRSYVVLQRYCCLWFSQNLNILHASDPLQGKWSPLLSS